MQSVKLWRQTMLSCEQKLEQRESFIDEIYQILMNSSSKAFTVLRLQDLIKEQIERQKLGLV